MHRIATTVLAAALVAAAGLSAVPTLGAGPSQETGGVRATRTSTLTGQLAERVFVQDCKCFNWVIEKDGRPSEVDITAVRSAALALNGQPVRATGKWMTYQRDGRTVRYLKITRLDPA
jgi:hypothetical protein